MAVRKSLQGVINVVRFNWHFYALAFCLIVLLSFISLKVAADFKIYFDVLLYASLYASLSSLLVSYYVYDVSSLYKLDWIDVNEKPLHILNINAGFDETSSLLESKYPYDKLTIMDFYDPIMHTEVSIKRARKAYPIHPDTLTINTQKIPLSDSSIDLIVICLAAHEIREDKERIQFFKELKRIIKENGSIYVVEHLRDWPNFLAYTIGFLHFLSKAIWVNTFYNAGLSINTQQKITPFITIYKLQHGSTH
jgi:ubiquinone/menaquinone biosynthesis C-methylase UbiE